MKAWKKSFWTVLVLAMLIRGVVAWQGYSAVPPERQAWDPARHDPDSYIRLAENLSRSGVYGFEASPSEEADSPLRGNWTTGHVTPTAFRPPLYPWLLSWGNLLGDSDRLPFGYVAALNWLLGIVTVALAYQLASLLRATPWLVALAVACDPLLLRSSQLAMTETLAAFAAALCLYACVWIREIVDWPNRLSRNAAFVALGTLFGLAVLVRPTFAPWAVLVGLWWLCNRRPPGIDSAEISNPEKQVFGNEDSKNEVSGIQISDIRRRGWFRNREYLAFWALGILICILPWMGRNQWQLGEPIWATSHGGYTLLLANNPSLYEHFEENGPDRGWDAASFHAMWESRDEPESAAWQSFWTDSALTTFPQSSAADVSSERLSEVGSDSEPSAATGELRDNKLAYHLASETIREHPGMFFVSCFYRMGWFWAAWPHDQANAVGTVAIGGWYVVWYGLTFFGLLRLKGLASDRVRVNLIWSTLLLAVSLTIVHSFYWSNMRMRSPLMVVVYVVGVSGLRPRGT